MAGAALGHDTQGFLPDGFRRAVFKLSGGIHVAHHHHIVRYVGKHFFHGNGVAEMISRSPCAEDGVDHLDGVIAAIVIDDQEFVGLHGVNDLFYIRFGKFLGQIGGEQTGQWFRQYNAGGAGIPIGKKVVDEESGNLFHRCVDKIRVGIAIDHNFGHIHQPSGKRVRAYHPCKNRSVLNQPAGLADGFDILTRTSCAHRGNGKGVGVLLGDKDGTDYSGNFIIGKTDF